MTSSVAPASVLDTVGRCGALHYEFARRGPRTVVAQSSCSSPWHYFPPSYLDDSGGLYVSLGNPSGGLVGGDHVTVTAELQAGTRVVMTSPSANRVYRSLGEVAAQEIRVCVGPDAGLEWLPEVTIPFAGSQFRQSIHVDLGHGATVLLWDAMASGRVAMNERWAFAGYENEIMIRTSRGESVIERFFLAPDSIGEVQKDWDYAGSFFVIGDRVSDDVWAPLESALAGILHQRSGLVLGGVSEPAAPGLVVKLLARTAPALTETLSELWGAVRLGLWKLPPATLRKY